MGAFVAVLFVFILFLAHTSESLGRRDVCVNNPEADRAGLEQLRVGLADVSFGNGTQPYVAARETPELAGEHPALFGVEVALGSIDKSKAWDEGENRLIMRGEKETDFVHVAEDLKAAYRCPASHHIVDSAGQGLSSYVAVAGLGADAPGLPSGDRRAGLFGYERATKLDQITDGLSTTMAVIETSNAKGPWKAGGPPTLRGARPESSALHRQKRPVRRKSPRWLHGSVCGRLDPLCP